MTTHARGRDPAAAPFSPAVDPLAEVPRRAWRRLEAEIESALTGVERVAAVLLDRPAGSEERLSAREECSALATRVGRLGFPAAAEIARRLVACLGREEHDLGLAIELAEHVDDFRIAVSRSTSEMLVGEPAGPPLLVVGSESPLVDELIWVATGQGFPVAHATGEALDPALAPSAVLACFTPADLGSASVVATALAEQYPIVPLVVAAPPCDVEDRLALVKHADTVLTLGVHPLQVLDEVRAAMVRSATRPEAVVCGLRAAEIVERLTGAGLAATSAASVETVLDTVGSSPAGRVLVIDAGPLLDQAALLVRLVRADALARGVPALVLTDDAHGPARLRARRDGVDDLVPPGVDDDELAGRVRRAARRSAELAPLLAENRGRGPLRWLNASLLLRRALVHATRRRLPVAMAVLALDAGVIADGLTEAITEVLLDELRAEDVVSHRDELHLVVGLPGAGSRVAERRLEQVLHRLELPHGSCRIGVAEFPADGRLLDDLLEAALEAVERARAGNGPLVVSAHWRPEAERGPDVLIVEPDEVVGNVLARIVAQAGLRTLWLPAGDEALVFLESAGTAGCPRAALVEFDLPGLDGLQLLERLTERGLLGHMRVLMLSPRVQESDLRRAYALGAVDLVTKPVSPLVLVQRLSRVLES